MTDSTRPTTYHTQNALPAIVDRLRALVDTARTFHIATLGCKVNQWEGDRIESDLRRLGLEPAGQGRADLAVVNACAVTHVAAGKSRRQLASLLRRADRAIVTGCLDGNWRPEGTGADRIDAIAKTELLAALRYIIKERQHQIQTSPDAEAFTPKRPASQKNARRTRAFVKIQDGCDAFCAYCIIPFMRPTVHSRPPGEIVEEVDRLLAAGHREIVLAGIHLGAYGRTSTQEAAPPQPGIGEDLTGLVSRLIERPGVERLRLSSIEANEIPDELIELMASDDRLAHHLHIPLQSGDDDVLASMNRRYTVTEFLDVVHRIRARLPSIGLTTDLIVGYPTETPESFERTLETCRAAGFTRMHVFPYSPREGTAASKLPPLSPQTVKQRAAQANRLAAELATHFHQTLIGQSLKVITEHRRDRSTGLLTGWSSEYVRVRFEGEDELKGRLVEVKIREADGEGVKGVADG